MVERVCWAATALALATFLSPAPQARDLTFEDRVLAQKAIEQVYYAHQIGATAPFEEAVPRDVLEKKVRTYLKQSLALQVFWNTPVTAEALVRERERMARGTRMPERLGELYAALGNDPFLIQECLTRQLLVDRLARNFFAYDRRLHAEQRQAIEALRTELASGRLDPFSDHPDRAVVELVREDVGEGTEGPREGPDFLSGRARELRRVELRPDEFDRWHARLPQRVGEVGPVVEKREMFLVRVVLEQRPDELRVASYAIKKKTWDAWWVDVGSSLEEASVEAVACEDDLLLDTEVERRWMELRSPGSGWLAPRLGDATSTASTCVPDDTWDNGSLDDLPDPRTDHTAVWTGSRVVVWGGSDGFFSLDTGGRYDPATDTWSPTSTSNAPSARAHHTAVWTGSLMIVWGGYDNPSKYNTGGRYDPATDTWSPTSTTSAPSARFYHTAVWTGSRMVVWGGLEYVNTGGRYDPTTDTWSPTSTTSAPAGRTFHTAVWTGSRMVVWGGYDGTFRVNTGGRYDPTADAWTPTATTNAPSVRTSHAVVWTGSRMVVWGGSNGNAPFNTGGAYDPTTNSWTSTSTTGAPAGRESHTAIWTGSVMVVWGGSDDTSSVGSGGRYDPATDTWTPTSTTDAPSGRSFHTAVWTGSRMVVWGGSDDTSSLDTGGRYDPMSDTWTPTAMTNAPSARHRHTAVWTGSRMVVWGGSDDTFSLDTGGRYDPATDTWSPTSTTDAPPARNRHTAVWTGSRMVVWGGSSGPSSFLDTGGRYDPATDTWTPTSTTNAPSRRRLHTAVWTGDRMVVWGGDDGSSSLNTGGRYDPTADTWTPTSTTNTPSARYRHTVVWTGSRMVVWGGDVGSSYLNTGGRYDPTTDTWTPTSTTNAPSGRSFHAAVWTGSRMVAWGGLDNSALNTGGRYDPTTDTWTPTSTTNAPAGGYLHTAVWTGSRVVVWGGNIGTGGRYDPMTDAWTPVSTTSAPSARRQHTAVWTGDFMIVWGGSPGPLTFLSSGGRYATNLPPSVSCSNPTRLAGLECQAVVDCQIVASCDDPNGDPISLDCESITFLGTGAHVVTVTCNDGCSETVVPCGVTVVDESPPVLTVSLAPQTLWPPNHKMVDVDASVAAEDNCDSPSVVLLSVTSSEPDNGSGDGNTTMDVQGVEAGMLDLQFALRAERSGSGPGRIYTATYVASDGAGNSTTALGLAAVPYAQEAAGDPIEMAMEGSPMGTVVTWSAAPGIQSYDLIRGVLPAINELDSVIALGPVVCLQDDSIDGEAEDPQVPTVGEAFFYLVEYFDGTTSNYGASSDGKPRVPSAGTCD